ncbi:hypothetical protein O6P43_015975 [Quillaja saponaria]|uniref:Uncharacterized protein n=1 Tax=Quillaja saponaria TaxID=32244 RepID=A0AAD7LY87_QUISA|nr:hypothetical protein O6P43_015975 [Quillaja saponaria]KAJ7966517.1 hypothetical protein O6P43_015975 [Quillaja saponaria]
MEEKKNYPSLPSNFVTLFQLQERWFKEKEREQREKEILEPDRKRGQQNIEQEQKRKQKLNEQGKRVIRNTEAGFGFENRNRKHFGRYNRNGLESNRCWKKVSRQTHEKFEVEAKVGDGSTERERKSKKSNGKPGRKKQKNKQRPSVKEKVVEVKKNRENASLEEGKEETKNIDLQRRDEMVGRRSERKPVIKSSIIQVERKFGGLSMNSEKEKKTGRLESPYNGYCQNQWDYKVRYGFGPYVGRFCRPEVRKLRGDGRVWVRKDGLSVGTAGGIETAGGSKEGSLLEQ